MIDEDRQEESRSERFWWVVPLLTICGVVWMVLDAVFQ